MSDVGELDPMLQKLQHCVTAYGWRCLSTTWSGGHERYLVVCAQGHRFERIAATLLYRTSPPKCAECEVADLRARWLATISARGGRDSCRSFAGLPIQDYDVRTSFPDRLPCSCRTARCCGVASTGWCRRACLRVRSAPDLRNEIRPKTATVHADCGFVFFRPVSRVKAGLAVFSAIGGERPSTTRMSTMPRRRRYCARSGLRASSRPMCRLPRLHPASASR